MHFGKLTFAAFMLAASPVLAADKIPAVDPVLCQYMISHVPDEGVEYKPGVDAEGKPVVAAETDDVPEVSMPEKTEFVLTVDLAKHLHMNVPEGLAGEARLGTIAIDEGEVMFNGAPLSGEAAHELKAICMTTQKKDEGKKQ